MTEIILVSAILISSTITFYGRRSTNANSYKKALDCLVALYHYRDIAYYILLFRWLLWSFSGTGSHRVKLAQRKGQKYVSITRPRRFGKTVIANMIASYFGKSIDSSKAFDHLRLSQHPLYQQHLNKHNVIHIMFNEVPDEITSYEEYSRMIKNTLTTQCNMLCVVRVFSNVTIICLYARIGFSPSAN